MAFVELEASGPADHRSAELLEVGLVLIDLTSPSSGCWAKALQSLVRPRRGLPALVTRLSRLSAEDFADAPTLDAIAPPTRAVLDGRCIVSRDVEATRTVLARHVSSDLADARYLDVRDLLCVTHPDAPDLQLETFTRLFFGHAERRRALDDALALLRVVLALAAGAEAEEARYREAALVLERFDPDSAWRPLLARADRVRFPDFASRASGQTPDPTEREEAPRAEFIEIAAGSAASEAPVPFDEDAIAAALGDAERGARHFPGYRVRPEQIELARQFCRNLAEGGVVLLEGGTGVGKSLAYLAAAIPFALERHMRGERAPILISTRTKLLQDQLLEKDIAAAARFLGRPELSALSIKGRANYVCEKRLSDVLAEGADTALLPEDRGAFAVLLACARTRPAGEVAGLPQALYQRRPLLRDLVRRSTAARAEQCSREDCGRRPRCPFGRRRAALARADLVVANHDLLLRWPPDYPRFDHVICDEGHELAGVADNVYALVVRPEDIAERIDEVFGPAPKSPREREPGPGQLPRAQRREAAREVGEARKALALDLSAIGRGLASRASEYGEVQLPPRAYRLYPEVARVAETAAARIEGIARLAEELDARAEWAFDEQPDAPEGASPVQKNAEALREAGRGLRQAFAEASDDVVAGFDRLVAPYDRWVLAIRAVSPADAFHQQFLEGLTSFAAVSASLFVGGDAFAALGELEIDERAGEITRHVSVESPFDYPAHMRVVALEGDAEDIVQETAAVITQVACELGGRTLGLFTSLRRMDEVAALIEPVLAEHSIELLAPRRAIDDPAGLVRRFRAAPGGAVLLGARTFWQGVDIPGDDLQAVVIEKLPFEVPTELRRRREERLRESGANAFERYRLGKMLLHLKQMTGRLIRSEEDRGLIVIVDGRTNRAYFRQLRRAFPEGVQVQVGRRERLSDWLAELGLGRREEAPPIID